MANTAAADLTVAVTAIVEHAELDAVRDGIRDSLADAGFVPGKTLTFLYESADADPDRAAAIADRLAGSAADVVVALSAPTALAVVTAISDRPVVMSAISDDLARDVIAQAPGRNRNVAGLVQSQPLREHLELVRSLAPAAPVVLVPVHNGAPDGFAKQVQRTAKDLGLAVRIVKVAKDRPTVDVLAAAAAAEPGAAVYLPRHAEEIASVTAVAALAAEHQMILVGATPEAVAQGAVATVTHDPYAVGRQTGDAIAEILAGRTPRDIALRQAEATYLVINRAAANEMGFAEATIEGADLVYE